MHTTIARAGEYTTSITDGTPHQDRHVPGLVTFTVETGAARVALECTPHELRELADELSARVLELERYTLTAA